MGKIKVRINGRGNAWPVILGQEHPFYDHGNLEDLANASCSILKSDADNPQADQIEWDLVIDAGHGVVQYLLKNCNRIPEAVFLTHPHIDHTLGLDWIVQSYYKLHNGRYPVYATVLCWEKVKTTYPHLIELVEFKELIPFQEQTVVEIENVTITPYPVYHGKSALGATMLYFNIQEHEQELKILFTGDVLCPLLRERDYLNLEDIDLLVTDANNRFPYPKSNHWSILQGIDNSVSAYLTEFIEQNTIGTFLYPHLKESISDKYARCFDYFLNQEIQLDKFFYTIESFVKKIKPKKVALLHYSGGEDKRYYKEKIFSTQKLENWTLSTFNRSGLTSPVTVPYVNQHIHL